MQLQAFANQAPAGEEELRQLTELFAVQQLVTKEADALVLKESQKTLEEVHNTVGTLQTENRMLQEENAALRERLATVLSQSREASDVYAAEAKAKDASHVEEIAALEEKNRRQQGVLDAFEKLALEQIEVWTKSTEQCQPWQRRAYEKILPSLNQQYALAKEGIFKDRKTLGPGCWEY